MIVVRNQTNHPNVKLIVTSRVLQMSCRKAGLMLHRPCRNMHDGPRDDRNLIRTNPKTAPVYIPILISSRTSCRGEHWDAKWPYLKLETELVSVLGFDCCQPWLPAPFLPNILWAWTPLLACFHCSKTFETPCHELISGLLCWGWGQVGRSSHLFSQGWKTSHEGRLLEVAGANDVIYLSKAQSPSQCHADKINRLSVNGYW